ncbi:hypothetical protein TNCV_611781 [Trichonephila clavipes]|nr:hypothetical protein TNCV_611781 [Trichonephila clavipes]
MGGVFMRRKQLYDRYNCLVEQWIEKIDRQGSFEVTPGNFNGISMSTDLGINEFEQMVNNKVVAATFAQPLVRFPAVRNNSCSWFNP